jgi:hypothetical protein
MRRIPARGADSLCVGCQVRRQREHAQLQLEQGEVGTSSDVSTVQVASGPAQTAGVEVVLRNGAVVRVEVGADVEYVARLVRALQG